MAAHTAEQQRSSTSHKTYVCHSSLLCTGRAQEDPSTSGRQSLGDSLRVLAQSQQIRCLGVMALSQGLTTNLVDVVWKTHLHMLHPDPGKYAVRLHG